MGMAASQARFLGLTARKTNTEYEGQQINQQRTTLSNQSANYYNQLLGMTVPVPPSVADYTKTTYTFEDGSLSNSISTMVAQKDGKYLISYTASWTNDFSVVSTASTIYTRKGEEGNYDYYVGAKKLRELGTIPKDAFSYNVTYTITDEAGKDVDKTVEGAKYDSAQDKYYTLDDQGNKHYISGKEGTAITAEKNSYLGDDEYLKTLSIEQIDKMLEEEEKYKTQLTNKYGASANGYMVRYVQNTSTGTWSPYFVNKDVLVAENTKFSDTGSSQSAIKTYTIGSAKETEEIKGVEARLEQDSTGRIISVTLNPDDPATKVTYAVTTNTVTDQAKYDDAMNQYEYDKYEYDQSIQNINAKIEVIQSEDKNLELRLKQLDTEQDAIQTEMDAVQKVIEKNTESTFKTFG